MAELTEPNVYLGVVDHLGLDPEFFLVNDKGKAVSSHLLGDRYLMKGAGYSCSYHVHRDGAALEIGMTPHTCRDFLIPTLLVLFNNMHKLAVGEGYKLSLDATVELSPESLKNAPPDVKEFGCQPDIDAYTLQDKAAIMPSPRYAKRFTGGHIHRGKKGDRMQLAAWAVAADYLIALPAVALLGEAHKEGEAERRKFYGQAGSYRVQPHGFEYRTLSSTGFLFHPVLTYAWFEIIRSLTLKPEDLRQVATKLKMGEVRHAINTHDVEAARQIYLDDTLFDEIIDKVARRSGARRELITALIKADMDGKSWNPSPEINWAWADFFDYFGTANHAYWGDQSAMNGLLDVDILPQREYVLEARGWSDETIKRVKPTRKYPKGKKPSAPLNDLELDTWFGENDMDEEYGDD